MQWMGSDKMGQKSSILKVQETNRSVEVVFIILNLQVKGLDLQDLLH